MPDGHYVYMKEILHELFMMNMKLMAVVHEQSSEKSVPGEFFDGLSQINQCLYALRKNSRDLDSKLKLVRVLTGIQPQYIIFHDGLLPEAALELEKIYNAFVAKMAVYIEGTDSRLG